jgi:hypothetical protein
MERFLAFALSVLEIVITPEIAIDNETAVIGAVIGEMIHACGDSIALLPDFSINQAAKTHPDTCKDTFIPEK